MKTLNYLTQLGAGIEYYQKGAGLNRPLAKDKGEITGTCNKIQI